ncbi:MAG: hypothetical protein NC324_02520 [Bacteroides sp.]|nr:hypothetical protein [Bacteroides sp.]
MKSAFDTDAILFGLLNGKMSNKGGIYVGDTRPENSTDEDIVINTIDLWTDVPPQIGTSNVNIYVQDTSKSINGRLQVSANRQRLQALADEAVSIIRSAVIKGLAAIPVHMTIMAEPDIKQHFVNIRIEWNILID